MSNHATIASAPADTANHVVRAVLSEIIDATATKPGCIVLALPLSQYQLHLRPEGSLDALRGRVGKKVSGIIRCQARRVDMIPSGGRYVEPVIGRPRRVQGMVLGVLAGENALVVGAGGAAGVDGLPLPVVVKLTDSRQSAAQFAPGQMVSTDVLDGATFTIA